MSNASPAAILDSDPTQRIAVLDILRGFSLLGIAVMNAPTVLRLDFSTEGGDPNFALYRWLHLLFQGHFFPIFSMLFGVSFALIMSRARQRDQAPAPVFLRRLALMFTLGLLHGLFNPGEVLRYYAIFGLLLLPFERLPLPLVLGMSGLLTLLSCWTTPILLPPATFLLGLSLQKLQVFKRPAELRPVLNVAFPVLALVATALTTWQATRLSLTPLWEVAGLSFDPATLAGLIGAAALMTGLWLLSLTWPKAPIFPALSLLGRMSLTNYILQTVVFVSGARAGLENGPYWLVFPVCLAAYAVNFAVSAWWLSRYRRGPLEWLWAWGSTLRRPAL